MRRCKDCGYKTSQVECPRCEKRNLADELQSKIQCVNCIDGKCVEQCLNTVIKD